MFPLDAGTDPDPGSAPPLHRVLDLWLATSLLTGGLVVAVADAAGVDAGAAVVANGCVALVVAAALLRVEPCVRTGTVWRLALVTTVVGVAGRWVAAAGGLSPRSVPVAAGVWVAAALLGVGWLRYRGAGWVSRPAGDA